MAKKKEMTIDDLATLVMGEFTAVRKEFRDELQSEVGSLRKDVKAGFFAIDERFNNLENDVSGLKKDIVWVKVILEAHTKMLKDLGEEKVFVVHRTDRIENDVEVLKKRLKIA